MALLEGKSVAKSFAGVVAVADASFDIQPGEIRTLIGPNGAGKTTLFNCICGFYQPDSGTVTFEEHSLAGLKSHRIARLGIARTFQNIRLYAAMTALENVAVGLDAHNKASVLRCLLSAPGIRRSEHAVSQEASELLDFVGLVHHAHDGATELSYGDQRRLEIARALGTRPKLLLLDEPAAGMNPSEKASLAQLILKITERGVTVFLIDHDMRFVMGVSHRIMVMDHGLVIADGTPSEIQGDPKVIEAYLGAPDAS